MKLKFVFFLMWLTSNSFAQVTPDKFEKLAWLSGTWDRTNISKPERTSHERWEKITSHQWQGVGVTMMGSDTTFVEKISIVVKDDVLYYVADVPENKGAVYFKLTEISDTGFTCENPDHDFPKKISYQLEGVVLKAQISGDGKAIDYWFKKR
jgi:hypothetical protein